MLDIITQKSKKASSLAQNLEFECRNHMAANNFHIDTQLIFDGKVHRFSIDAKKSKKDEWYIGSTITLGNNELLTVTYGSFSTGEKYTFSSWSQFKDTLSKSEREAKARAIELSRIEADRQLKEQHDASAQHARKIFDEATSIPTAPEHTAYIEKKSIEPIGIKYGYYHAIPAIIIPLYNIHKELRSLQYIFRNEDGSFSKRFLLNGEIKGNFLILANKKIQDSDRIYIAEGWATAVSIYMALEKVYPVVFGIGAYSLYATTASIRQLMPDGSIILCPDNDASKVGEREAKKAAAAFNCTVVVPQELNDFNDVHVAHGLTEVKKQLEYKKEEQIMKIETTHHSYKKLLPDQLRLYLDALCTRTAADPLMILSSVISMIGGYLGNKVCIPKTHYFQDLYPNLWILCIAPSGAMKTTALNLGSALAKKKQKLLREQKLQSIAELKRSGATDYELHQEALRFDRQDIILPYRSTMEALIDHLQKVPSGVLYQSEFGAFIKNLSKTYNADTMGTLTDLYDVPAYYAIKTVGKGDRVLEKVAISICGVSTIDWLQGLLKETDMSGGFMVRFLIYDIPPSDDMAPALPEPESAAFVAAESAFENHLNTIIAAIKDGRNLKLSAASRILYEDCYKKIMKTALDCNHPIIESFAKRWCPEILKISIIMQMIHDPHSYEIEQHSIAVGFLLVEKAMESTGKIVVDKLLNSPMQNDAKKLMDYIARKMSQTSKPVLRQSIMKNGIVKSPTINKGDAAYANEVLDFLLQTGELEVTKAPSNKKFDEFYIPHEKVG